MAKTNIKALAVEHGEKWAFIGAGAFMVLLMLVGLVIYAGGTNSTELIQEVENNTNSIESTIQSKSKGIEKLPSTIDSKDKGAVYASSGKNHLFFAPFFPPDTRPINPTVLPITEIQLDFKWTKIKAYDVRDGSNGPEIAVLKAKAKGDKLDTEKSKKLADELKGRQFPMRRIVNMGEGGGNIKKDGPPRKEAAVIEGGTRQYVDYIPLDPEKLNGHRIAWTLMPQRMVVIQASFPYREQIKEIQKALRLSDPMQVFDVYKPEEVPLFHGVLVQRQILTPDGKVESSWRDLNVVDHYMNTIYPRKFGDANEDPRTRYAMLPFHHSLTMPLPFLQTGEYDKIRLPSILKTIEDQLALNKPPEAHRASSQLFGQGNPFAPVVPNKDGDIGQPPPAEGINVFKPPVVPGKEDPAAASKKLEDLPENILIRLIDNDIEPGKQYQYRMKVLMQNPNWAGPKDKKGQPVNAVKRTRVARPSDADIMLLGADVNDEKAVGQREFMIPAHGPHHLEGEDLKKTLAKETEWKVCPETVSVPREEYLFGVDSPPDPDPKALDSRGQRKPQIPLEPGKGQAILQYQRWMAYAQINNFKEPVADWVVAEVKVARSTYVGGKQFVSLPLWSSEFNQYILRETPDEKPNKPALKGVRIDPTQPGTRYAVIEVEGGMRRVSLPRSIEEESAAEILLVDDAGNLQVRSSYADRNSADWNKPVNPEASEPKRINREGAWRTWVKDTLDKNKVSDTGQPAAKKDDFK